MDVCSVLITGQAFIFCGFSDKRIWNGADGISSQKVLKKCGFREYARNDTVWRRFCVSGNNRRVKSWEAYGTAALEFAREVLLALEAAPEDKITEWYNFHKLGCYKAAMPQEAMDWNG